METVRRTGKKLFEPGNPGGPGRPKGDIDFRRLKDAVAKQIVAPRLHEMAQACVKTVKRRGDVQGLKILMELFFSHKLLDHSTKVQVNVGQLPSFDELLSTTNGIAFTEMKRLEIKSQNGGLDVDELKHLVSLQRNMIESKTVEGEIIKKQRDELAKMTNEELDALGKELFETNRSNGNGS